MTPGWLLDIDGVINALGHRNYQDKWPNDKWFETSLGPPGERKFRFRISPSVRDFILEMHNLGVDIRWHTTWQHDAKVVADYLELPMFPVHPAPEFNDFRYRSGWWKAPSAFRLFKEDDRPWIWTDDDLSANVLRESLNDACLVVNERIPQSVVDAKYLFISPDEDYGLTPIHTSLIRGFVARHMESASSVV